ncbi:SymE family type I addiction module toxin [Erwinia pyri]
MVEAGFDPDTPVTVTVEHGQLIIWSVTERKKRSRHEGGIF